MKKIIYAVLILVALALFLNISDVSATNSTNTTFTVDQVGSAAGTVQPYIETNHQLPGNVSIAGSSVTMPQFLQLEATAIYNINGNVTTPLAVGSYNPAPSPFENLTTGGSIAFSNYVTLVNNTKSFMGTNGQAPNNETISQGNMRFESLIYTFSQILNSYEINNKILPSYVTYWPWSVVSNSSTVFLSTDDVNSAAFNVKSNIESNHVIPNNVMIGQITVSVPQFLRLATTAYFNDYNTLSTSIILGNYSNPISPSENVTSGTLSKSDIQTITSTIQSSMDSSHQAPNYYTTSSMTKIRYESLVYLYSELLDYYRLNKALPTNGTTNITTGSFLPGNITIQPWSVVSNGSLPSFTLDQIIAAAGSLVQNIEIPNSLPSTLNIAGVNVSTATYLLFETLAIQNLNGTLFTSRFILENYSAAPSPSESITSQFINQSEYVNTASNVASWMYSSLANVGTQRAPNYSTLSTGGKIRYESMVYIFAGILKSYQTYQSLPSSQRFVPWAWNSNVHSWENTVTGPHWFITPSAIFNGASYVKSYIETNHSLPTSVPIYDKPALGSIDLKNFLEIETGQLLNLAYGSNSDIILGSYNSPYNPSETVSLPGNLNSTEFLNLANGIQNFYDTNGLAPSAGTTSLGDVRFDSLVYIYSELLNFYSLNSYFPNNITVYPWTKTANSNFFTLSQVLNSTGDVQSYTETHHALPTTVNMSGTYVNMSDFLQFETAAVQNVNCTLYTSFNLYGSYDPVYPPSNAENITKSGIINNTEYIDIAHRVMSFMNNPQYHQAPNFAYTSLGQMRFDSLVYMFAQLLNYYNSNGQLPDNVTFTPWSTVSNSTTQFYTLNQIESAAGTVQSSIETNHSLPGNVPINGTSVSMPQLLQLESSALSNINGNLYTSYTLGTYTVPTNCSENLTVSGTLSQSDYLDLANNITSYMNSYGQAPSNMTTSLGVLQYRSLIYLFSQILNSYNSTQALPNYITINPWSVVSNNSTKFIGMDQINNASASVKSYIETNHGLPDTVVVSGANVNMAQFVQLATSDVVNTDGNLKTSIILGNLVTPTNSTENIVSGYVEYKEYLRIAEHIQSYTISNGTVPSNIYQTILGTQMSFPSLVYMFSNILNSYVNTNSTLPDSLQVTPWIAVSNPNKIYDYQTQKTFTTIQSAIDDSTTSRDDTIALGIANISENVVVDKPVFITSLPGLNVTVTATNPSLPVFTINNSGSGSTIKNLIIQGATTNYGVYILNSTSNMIYNNTLTGNINGISMCNNATGNQISGNSILNNSASGVYVEFSDDNTISGNSLTNNVNGISINSSNNTIITSNTISNNSFYGIQLYCNSTNTTANYNRIVGNGRIGLYNYGNGTVDATNNWWGHNTPTISSTGDIYIASGSTGTYNPWLILNVRSSTDRSNRTGTNYNYIVTADLTQNNQGNTTSDSNLPDNIPINFTTTLGNISTPSYTRYGKAVAILNSTTAGNATIRLTLDNQTLSTIVNIQSINTLGITNTRTNQGFSKIQDAIDDTNTLNGDTITLADGTYTENVVLYKRLTIMPVSGAKVTIQTDDPSLTVLMIPYTGSGSTLKNLNITGAANAMGVLAYSANDVSFIGDNIFDNEYGVELFNSDNNILSGNNISNNWIGTMLFDSNKNQITGNNIISFNYYGLSLCDSNQTRISGANVTDNRKGISLKNSNNAIISGNNLNNNWDAIYLRDSNSASISGNAVTNNVAGIPIYDSQNTAMWANTLTNNTVDTTRIDSTGIMMATSIITCGPASLGTVLQWLGVNATEQQLTDLSWTNRMEPVCGVYCWLHRISQE